MTAKVYSITPTPAMCRVVLENVHTGVRATFENVIWDIEKAPRHVIGSLARPQEWRLVHFERL